MSHSSGAEVSYPISLLRSRRSGERQRQHTRDREPAHRLVAAAAGAAGWMPPPHIPMFRSLPFCGESGEYGVGAWPVIAWAHAASASITRRMANRPCRFNRCSCNAAARPRRAWPPIGLALLFLPFATRELTGSTSSPASRCRQGIAGTRIAHANYPLRARLKDSPPRRSPLASMSDRDR